MQGRNNHKSEYNATLRNVNREHVVKCAERRAVRLGFVRLGYVKFGKVRIGYVWSPPCC